MEDPVKPGAFWEDLAEDMKDPVFAKEYDRQSRMLAKYTPSPTAGRRTEPCFNCGDTTRIKASASRAGDIRYFCHDTDRSCYNECRGKYFSPGTEQDPTR